jgi:protein phosphatase
MENDAATLYCPNELCQAANPLTHKFCQRCSTPLPKRYLWVVGDSLSVECAGEILGDRYLIINESVVLDTKPGLLPQTPELENTHPIRPYLRLISYRLHIPQV